MKVTKKILSQPLFKVVSLNSFSILIKISIGFITSKVIAVFLGPSGMALVGNFRNFISSTESFATLGFENGLVKYVAEHKKQNEELTKTLSTVFISVVVSCLSIGLILFVFSSYFNQLIFNGFDFSFVFKVFALALPFYIANMFLVATINGLGAYKKVIVINIIGNIIGLILSFALIFNFRTEGALVSIILSPALLFFISFFFLNKEVKILKHIHFRFYSFSKLNKMASYSLMALVSSVLGPMVLFAIRKNIIQNIGLQEAGYWEAMNRMSAYYFLFISSILGLYFLPKLAVAIDNLETKKLFWSYYKGIMPIFCFGLFLMFILKKIIIELIFTNDFLPISKLFFWQLIGDFFKAASYILGFQFYAKKLTKAFIITEISSLAVFYFSSIYLVSQFHLEGVVMAYAFTYFIYLIVLGTYFRKSLF